MFKNMLSAMFVIALSGAALLPVAAQAGPVLIQDFWGKKADGTNELFATLKVDVADATLSAGSVYDIDVWRNFTLFGEELLPANNYFVAQFDISNLYAGFQFLSFDVLAPINNVTFQYYNDVAIPLEYYTFYSGKNPSDIFTDNGVTTNTSVVPAPASILLILIGFAALSRRRSR